MINRVPSKSLGNKTPYEMLFHSPPSYTYLRCFGCLCFISTSHSHRHKFAPKSRKCVFLGNPHGIKGYKVMDLATNFVYISRDIVFYESVFPYASTSSPSTSYLTDFIFPHVTYDSSCTSNCFSFTTPAHSILDSTLIPDSDLVVSHSDPVTLEPTTHTSLPDSNSLEPTAHASIPDPIHATNPDLAITPTAQLVQPPLRRPTRPHVPPSYLSDYSCKTVVNAKPQSSLPYALSDFLSYSHLGSRFKSLVLAVSAAPSELVSFHQAVQFPEWRAAMDKEIKALEVNNTWTLAPLPPGKTAIGCKWVYRIKYFPNGSIERYKARLVAKGFTQKLGLDYSETFSPVAKFVSIRIVLSLATVKGWFLHQMDVNNAFLHGDLVEDVYMSFPPGFHSKGEGLVCKLNKSLYGLKQASRQWFEKFSTTILQIGFVQSKSNYSMFTHSQ